MKRVLFILLSVTGWVYGDQCQITSPLPMPITIAGCTYASTLPSNSTSYIQNTLTPSTTFQVFGVQTASTTLADYLTYIGSGQCLQTGANGLITGTGSACSSGGGGGGGASTLAVTTGTKSGFTFVASSPTAVVNFDGSQFAATLQGGSTAFVTIAYSSNNVTGSYTTTSTDTVVDANCASACTVTLPTAVGISGKRYNVKIIGAGIVTIATTSAQTIDGSTTITPSPNQYADIEVESNGSNWDIL